MIIDSIIKIITIFINVLNIIIISNMMMMMIYPEDLAVAIFSVAILGVCHDDGDDDDDGNDGNGGKLNLLCFDISLAQCDALKFNVLLTTRPRPAFGWLGLCGSLGG